MAELTPAERRQWIVDASPEAQALQELPLNLPQDKLEAVTLLKYEAALRLANPDLPDADRAQTEARLTRQLQSLLGEQDYAQLERAEDPRYGAYLELSRNLGLSQAAVDFVFDWQRHVQETETALRAQGLTDDDVMQQMQTLVAQASQALQQSLTPDQFDRLLEQPQSMFLLAYQPLDLE